MSLNQLYFDHQLAVIPAASPDSLKRLCFEVTAANTAGRLGRLQRSLWSAAAVGWEQHAATPLDIPSYASDVPRQVGFSYSGSRV